VTASLDPLRMISLISAFAGCFLWILLAIRRRLSWAYVMPALVWLLHVAVFYSVYFLANISPEFLNNWGAAVRLHAI
jgi:hypothetical protein